MVDEAVQMTSEQIEAHNEYAGFYGYTPTKAFQWLVGSPCKTTTLFSGNQFGKGETVVMDAALRVMNAHPQKHKNIRPEDRLRTIRISCATLPTNKESDEELKNTIYPVIKRRFPPYWIAAGKDITQRSPTMKVCDTRLGSRKGVNIEFASYGQEVKSQAGVQIREQIQDEESSQDWFEEQQARTLATGGDMVIAFTPVPGQIGWMFDTLYEKARIIYRTPRVRQRFKERFGEDYPEVEKTGSKQDIAVIMAATDDNPVYDQLAKEIGAREGRDLTGQQYLDEFFTDRYGEDKQGGDQDIHDARRYGIFRQLSGRVHKQFSPRVQVISGQKYFPEGMPHEWKHFRGCDYHQKVPWAVVWICRSPRNEMFVWRDAAFKPGSMMTYDIAGAISDISGQYVFHKNLIDPLSNQTQVNTNTTTLDDLNRMFYDFKREGRGTGGFWVPWDTKGTRGREELTQRLINSQKVGRPFNNEVVFEDGRKVTLPTIWFLDDCKRTIEALKEWRYLDWETRQAESRNDENEKVQGKWSHFPITIECLLKDPAVTHSSVQKAIPPRHPKTYFRGQR